MKISKKLSLLSFGTIALTLGSALPIQAQAAKAQTLQNLNLRTGPSTSNPILLTIKKDTVIEIIEKKGEWAKVKYNSTVGYVSCKYIKTVQENDKPTDSNNNLTIMKCNANKLNVRSGPSTADNLIGTFEKGDNVEVIENLNNGWSKIKFEGKVAYVSTQYLSKKVSTNPPTSDKNMMKCVANTLNIRSGPGTTYSIVGKLRSGDKVRVVKNLNNGWTEIEFRNSKAYVSSKYLSK